MSSRPCCLCCSSTPAIVSPPPVPCTLLPQGSSEYNITVLIDQKDAERGLRAVHSRFYLSDTPIGVSRGWEDGEEGGGWVGRAEGWGQLADSMEGGAGGRSYTTAE